ncbi:MAG: histidine kinase dimerization/phosphoacceptor domain-containing protein, partial [Candidatus Pacearchaeota archaeon]|nr:histidine kinase dimerization/phosphoacceptor domain-containing protein [Candidatus Pacearchaeota archaeon]
IAQDLHDDVGATLSSILLYSNAGLHNHSNTIREMKKTLQKIIAIFSDNGPLVPLNDSKTLKKKLGAKIIVEKKRGHFDGKKYPSILKATYAL